MKNYSEIYVSLREEIMQAIDKKVDSLLAKYDVDNLSDLENAPTFRVYTIQFHPLNGWELCELFIEDISVGGSCKGFITPSEEEICFELNEFITDSLIEIYEKLCEYGN